MQHDKEFLQQINDSVNLIDYVTAHGYECHEKGDNVWVHCPLHNDDTASLAIRKSDNFAHCFSCGFSGKIISWLWKIEGLSFEQAVEKAAKLAGTDITKMCRSETLLFNRNLKRGRTKEKTSHIILEESAYAKYTKATPREWINEGITPEAMEFFEVRYDPASSRIVYPVRMLNGDLIGVKGRSIFPADQCKKLGIGKYMNYYEVGTADFLQGLDKTLHYAKAQNELILFEGIKSCMKAYTWGHKNCAAVESHSINPHQVRLLVDIGTNITVAFDSDVTFEGHANEALRSALDTLSLFTNVYIVRDKGGLLGGASAKNSPVDCGQYVWNELYERKERWC